MQSSSSKTGESFGPPSSFCASAIGEQRKCDRNMRAMRELRPTEVRDRRTRQIRNHRAVRIPRPTNTTTVLTVSPATNANFALFRLKPLFTLFSKAEFLSFCYAINHKINDISFEHKSSFDIEFAHAFQVLSM